ncbi:hypothetical protein U91I_02318 [alpha proteobacterium U9-1i]|nr:hypothetical protein U91I_02318 [alpha proteobacterium U9-1i]
MALEIIGLVENAETFAKGSQIREIARLRRVYGKGNWRKRKGTASVRLPDGAVRRVELHWYEASGLGKFEFKIKAYLD